MSQSFDTSGAPHLTLVRCAGNLSIIGVERRTITVSGNDENIKVERQGETLTITAESDCDVRCPPGASVTIKQVDGDLNAQDLEGLLAVESVNGDVTLRNVGPATLCQVRGDLTARGVKGELRAEAVNGNAKLRHVSGALALESVHGDLSARDLGGGAAVRHVGGDVSLNIALAAGASYRFEAGGDISAKVEAGSGARLTLEGGEVHCRLPLQNVERASGRIVGTLGDGSAELTLRAGGDLSVTESSASWSCTGEEQWGATMESWAQQFEAQMGEMQRKLEERLAGIPYVDAENIARRARKAAERARRQAERSAERARMRAERASRKHEHHGHGMRWSWSPPQPSKPPAEQVTDAERMAILKMVADKKITADEASRLLAALEGEA